MPELVTSMPSIHDDCTCQVAGKVYETGKQTCEKLYELSCSQSESKDDLLRATLVFACSTIDSVGKQLANDCLKELIDIDTGAQESFENYIARTIENESKKILSRALASPDYRGELIKTLIESLEAKSLQSHEQLSRLTAYFGVMTDKVVSVSDAKKIFEIRQIIIHEMDIEPANSTGTPAQRRQRAENELKEHTEKILVASKNLIQEVHNKIHEPRAEG